MKYFKLPDLGEGLQEAVIVEWHVKPGENIDVDQPLVSVETAKSIVDVPSPQQGAVLKLHGGEGDTVYVGEPLVEFDGEDDDSGTVVGDIEVSQGDEVQQENFVIGAIPGNDHGIKARPQARRLAKRLQIDLAQVSASGKQGMITQADVEKAHKVLDEVGSAEIFKGVRKAMSENMSRAHREIVRTTIVDDADIQDWQAGNNPTVRLVRAVAVAAKAEPAMNAWFDGEYNIRRLAKHVDIAVAVDTEHGLFVPVVRDVASKSADGMREDLSRLIGACKDRTISPADQQGSTIGLSNFGTIAGRYGDPVIVPPMVANIGAGGFRDELVVFDGKPAVRRRVPLSVSFDHRAVTGGEAARFLRAMMDDLALPE